MSETVLVNKSEYFLDYNTDNVMKHLLAIEDHLRWLQLGYRTGHASCIIKHLLQLEEQCDEGISHAASIDDRDKVDIFKYVKKSGKNLKIGLQRETDPIELIKKIRKIRSVAEGLNPIYNLEECETCGDITETIESLKRVLEKIREKDEKAEFTSPTPQEPERNVDLAEDFLKIERNTAEQLLQKLSEKYDVKPPKLEISGKCGSPSQGLYSNGTIYVCKSGVNLHVLAHEWYHHYQKESGKWFSEHEAEHFANDFFQKPLYKEQNYIQSDGKMVKNLTDVAVLYGGMHIGEGVEYALKFADAQRPGGIAGVPISLIGDILGTVGGVAGAMYLDSPYDLLSVLIGGHLSTDLWRQAEEAVTTAGLAVPTYTPSSSEGPAVKQEAKQVAQTGKYIVP